METILNFLWLAVTLTIAGVWSFRWLPSQQHPRMRMRREAIALVCALALLFPAISLTDDLHPESVAVDAASGKRNACQLLAHFSQVRQDPGRWLGKSLGHSRRAAVAILPHSVAPSLAVASNLALASHSASPSFQVIGRHGRSPPLPAA